MANHEYVFIDQLILDHPLEQQVPETTLKVINFVEEAEANFDQHTVEVF